MYFDARGLNAVKSTNLGKGREIIYRAGASIYKNMRIILNLLHYLGLNSKYEGSCITSCHVQSKNCRKMGLR